MSSVWPPVLSSPTWAPPLVKLRDSCLNCAKSKLRCGREKPACARCMRLGKSCDYVPCRRPGRTRASASEKERRENVEHAAPTQQTAHSPEVSMPWTTLVPGATQVPTTLGSPIYQDMVLNSGFLTGEPVMSSPLTYDPWFCDATGVSLYQPMFDSIDNVNDPQPETAMAYQFTQFNPHHPVVPMPMPMPNLLRNTILDSSIISNPNQPVMSPATDTHLNLPTMPTEPPLQPPCSCPIRAFGLFQQLSLSPSKISVFKEQYTSDCTRTSQWSTEGKQCLEEITSMVKCTCSEDPDLLSFKSLLAFKIMGVFKITSRELEKTSLANDHNLGQYMDNTPDIEGHSYSSKIRVEDLHLVQQLVSSLSLQLRRLRAGKPMEESAISDTHATNYVSAANRMEVVDRTEENKGFVPYTLLRQLEVELRRSLQNLFTEIGEDGHQGDLFDSSKYNTANY
ncbi:hypothetical protein F5B22DRAFT_370383 [Xylaria bambusicola]|uniref:uncharacterized protein n=1 Tax=Xylaria bambusicola TaxID=326684 RepID=UPI002007C37F|nr:uncharacterized protein F5B22DRAFT_370383 [Xylaria bambusicola]KAI0509075.1 hypothetical protein F5B22DRAFT_370383 [Xylaria bambusicola]